jgi:DHA2 family multidrug resistance protein
MSETATTTQAPLPPLEGWPLAAVGIVASLSAFIVVLDLTVTNVSIPTIAAGLGASPHEGTWMITAYAVPDAITVLLAGWLAARFGPARVMIGALLLFGLASVLCGLSSTLAELVTFRIIQGFAGGPLVPLSQAIIYSTYPRERSMAAMTTWTTMATLGPAVGPLVGGYICEHMHWSWIFLINLPVVIVAAVAVWRLLYHRDPPPEKRPIDFTGFGILVVWVGAAQLMLDRGYDLDWFHSNLIIGFLIVAVVGFFAFLIWEMTDAHPIINLRVFGNIHFCLSLAILCLAFAAIFGSLIMTPLWLQTSMDYTPTLAAAVMVPQTLISVCISPILGRFSHVLNPRHLMVAGLTVMAAIYYWRTGFTLEVTFAHVAFSQFVHGIGSSLFFSAAVTTVMSFVKREDIGTATSLIAFCRTMAIAISASALTTAWLSSTAQNRGALVDRFHGSNAAERFEDLGFAPERALHYVDNLVQSQAVMLATNHIFMILTSLFAVALFALWFLPRGVRAKS